MWVALICDKPQFWCHCRTVCKFFYQCFCDVEFFVCFDFNIIFVCVVKVYNIVVCIFGSACSFVSFSTSWNDCCCAIDCLFNPICRCQRCKVKFKNLIIFAAIWDISKDIFRSAYFVFQIGFVIPNFEIIFFHFVWLTLDSCSWCDFCPIYFVLADWIFYRNKCFFVWIQDSNFREVSWIVIAKFALFDDISICIKDFELSWCVVCILLFIQDWKFVIQIEVNCLNFVCCWVIVWYISDNQSKPVVVRFFMTCCAYCDCWEPSIV